MYPRPLSHTFYGILIASIGAILETSALPSDLNWIGERMWWVGMTLSLTFFLESLYGTWRYAKLYSVSFWQALYQIRDLRNYP